MRLAIWIGVWTSAWIGLMAMVLVLWALMNTPAVPQEEEESVTIVRLQDA